MKKRVKAIVCDFDGTLSAIADAAIRVPETETYKVQELHLPVCHALCAVIEQEMFP